MPEEPGRGNPATVRQCFLRSPAALLYRAADDPWWQWPRRKVRAVAAAAIDRRPRERSQAQVLWRSAASIAPSHRVSPVV